MTLRRCPQESELTSLLRQGGWPQAAPAELHAHVDSCPACSAHAGLLAGLDHLRAQSMTQPRLTPPGQIWWRAQLRRKYQASVRLRRPLVGAQVFSLALALAAAVGFLAWIQATTGALGSWSADLSHALGLDALRTASSSGHPGSWLLLPVLVLAAAVSGAVVYLAGEKH